MNSELLLFRRSNILNLMLLHCFLLEWQVVKSGTHNSEALLSTRSFQLIEDVTMIHTSVNFQVFTVFVLTPALPIKCSNPVRSDIFFLLPASSFDYAPVFLRSN